MKKCDVIQLALLEDKLDSSELEHLLDCKECQEIKDMVDSMKTYDVEEEPSEKLDMTVKSYAYTNRPSRSWRKVGAVVTALAAILVCAFVVLSGATPVAETGLNRDVAVKLPVNSDVSAESAPVVASDLDFEGLSGEQLLTELEMELMVSTDMVLNSENEIVSLLE